MTLRGPHQPDSKSIPDSDDQTLWTPPASTVDVPANPVSDPDVRHQVPSDGRTFIIRAISKDNNVLTLLNGNVVLAPMNTRGSIYWTCVETQGWFGFRNCSSNKFLGHGLDGRLKCQAQERDGHRQFTITPMPLGGYIMQMLDWWTLRPVVVNPENGLQKLGRTGNKLSEGVVWEFMSIEPRSDDI
ncbi:hypothetical protein yc1106_03032 [Curvularia clavata]|uniref:Uncharacterized protein n=1 Tax=Curvularia clavata TaxID=95742 RepID=A0A9Q9DQ04_CURCL|nr:hypothetical protein yc1106_03032 [Curvularia clavata]